MRSDIEWKFSRSILYIEFIKDGSALPVPFNLIPNPIFIYKSMLRLVCKVNTNQESEEMPPIDRNRGAYANNVNNLY
jgi:hypothetical protein